LRQKFPSSKQTNRRHAKQAVLLAFFGLFCAIVLFSFGCTAALLDKDAETIVVSNITQVESETFVGFDRLKTLDLRAVEADAALVDRLSAELPNCTILWNVPLCGERFDSAITELTLPTGCNDADLAALRSFPSLKKVDATLCFVSEAFAKAAQAYPDISFVWNVTIDGFTIHSTDTSFVFSGDSALTPEQLGAYLFGLPALTQIDLNETGWTAEQIAALQSAYPNKTFLNGITLFGQQIPASAETIDLSSAADVDVAALPELLSAFPALKSVNLQGHTLTLDQLNALQAALPNVVFSCSLELFGQTVSTDATQLELNGYPLTSPEEVAAALKYLPNLTYADLCNCGLSNEQMGQLISAFPKVKFVWMIQVGAWEMRTDITAFSKGNRKVFPNNMGRFVDEEKANLHDEDIVPLKYCTDLVFLDLGHGNRISDLTPLSGLTKLRALIVSMNKIKDISPLKSLTNLECLEIYQNPITDISPVTALPKLRYLNCSATLFNDITPLLGLKNLEMLWFVSVKNVTKEQRDQLVEALPDCEICFKASSSGEGGWTGNGLYIEYQTAYGLPYDQ
jgi:hypothetical protein